MNPTLKQLGFDDRDRVVILHADDVGMCQATLPALADLLDAGLVSSAATMVPCPWFPAVAALCRQRSDVDLGVHLTLTCEYRSYRWGPISTRDAACGLLDGEGYSPLGPGELAAQATAEAVQTECRAQLRKAEAAGLDVTHIDTHQVSVLHPRFVGSYAQLALESRLPLMLPRLDQAGWLSVGQAMGLDLDAATAATAADLAEILLAQGLPLLDGACMLPLNQPARRLDRTRQALASLPAGLTHFVFHPAQDTPELRAIAPDWPSRVADYEAFTGRELRDWVRSSGIQVIGYRTLRDLLRA